MQSWEWHQVCSDLVQIDVKIARKAHRRGQVRQKSRHQSVHAVEPRLRLRVTTSHATAGLPPINLFATDTITTAG